MEYTVIIDRQSYSLPNKTMKVAEELDRLMQIDTVKGMKIRDKYNQLFTFEQSLLGADAIKEIFGSDNLDNIDLSLVTVTFLSILDAYEKPIADYKNEKTRTAMSGIQIDKVIELAKVAEKMPNKND